MASSVEDEIVAMKFDNRQFEQGITQSLSSMAKLKTSLKFDGASKGLTDLDNNVKRFSMNPVSTSIDGAKKSFLALSAVGLTVISTLTSKAISAGETLARNFLSPIKAGFSNYEEQINAVQTILANTKSAGTNLHDVTGALNELNKYANLTIYNFSEMAHNIGTFTAAGVGLKDSVNAIKGIANLAALSGSNSQQASTAMYQLSQAISAGQVHLQDWNSVVNAGMGGTVFQRALANTAAAMGTLNKSAVKLTGPMKNVSIAGESFRQSLQTKPGQQSWLTSKVLTNTLAQFTGDLTKAQLKAQGFNDAQIKAIQAQAKTAENAATQIKTVSQLTQALKEEVASSWAQVFKTLLGNINQAKKILSPLHNTIENMLRAPVNAFDKLLKGWAKLGGRNIAIDSIKTAFEDVVHVMDAVKKGFRDVFPAETPRGLLNITKAIDDFMHKLTPGKKTLDDITRIAKGFFSILDIGVQIIEGVLKGLGIMFSTVGKGSGGFLDFAAHVADLISNFNEFLKKSGLITGFFTTLGNILSVPIALIIDFAKLIGGVFSGIDAAGNKVKKASDPFKTFADRVHALLNLGAEMGAFGKKIGDAFARIGQAVQPALHKISQAFGGIFGAIGDALKNGNYSAIFDALNTGIFAAIFLAVRKFLKGGGKFGIGIDFGKKGGLFGNISESFEALTGSLKAMEANVQASTLEKIAIAVGILAAAMFTLSLIPSKKLTSSLTAMSVGFGQLLLSMAALTKMTGAGGFAKLPLIAAAMIELATAMVIFAGAVTIMSRLSWSQLSKGLAGLAGMLTVVTTAVIALSSVPGGLVRTATGMVALAVAIRIIASAISVLGKLSWSEIARGLTAVAGTLVAVGLATKLMPKSLILIGPGLVAVAIAMNILAGAMKIFGTMNWDSIGKGLVAMAGALALVVAAVNLIPPDIILIGPGLVAVAVAVTILAGALKVMGGMSWSQVAKALVVLAGALVILAGAMYLMEGAVVGAAAMVVVAGAIAVLTPALIALGAMSWEGIVKALVALAGAFTIIGLAGLILTPLIPSLLGLGAALLLLGAGLALAGAGALAFATAFTLVATAGAAGVAVMNQIFEATIKAIPAFAKALAQGLGQFIVSVGNQTNQIVHVLIKLISTLLKGLIKLIPEAKKVIQKLITALLDLLDKNIDRFVRVGIHIMLAILTGLGNNMKKLTDAATQVITKFMNALGNDAPKLADSGAKMIIKMMNGIAQAINNNADAMRQAGINIALAIINGMTFGISSHIGDVVGAVGHVASSAISKAKSILHINSPSKVFHGIGVGVNEGFRDGINASANLTHTAVGKTADGAIAVMKAKFRDAKRFAPELGDISPRITPVLDLTQFQKDATKIGTHLGKHSVTAQLSTRQANDISAAHLKALTKAADAQDAKSKGDTNYNQYITSPKALTALEIYRGTKSLIAFAREVN